MSAFLCSPAHIGRLAAFLHADHNHRDKQAADIALTLAKANLASVAYRYDEREDQAAGGYNTADNYLAHCMKQAVRPLPQLPPVVILKLVSCLDYQSCELDSWPTSEARRLLDTITAVAHRRLPGYDEAPWGYEEPAQPQLLSVLK